MVNNYLQAGSSCRVNSLFVWFAQPYVEGIYNFTTCFSLEDGSRSPSLIARVSHFVVGVCLLCPILNTITLLFLRLYSFVPEHIPLARTPLLFSGDQELSSEAVVKRYVEQFLWQYIQRKVTPANEPSPRVPLMELIHAELASRNTTDLEPEAVEAIAFNEYLYRSAIGLYVHLRQDLEPMHSPGAEIFYILDPATPEFEMFVQALALAISKDFPSKHLTLEEVEDAAAQGLFQVNQERLATEGIELEAMQWQIVRG